MLFYVMITEDGTKIFKIIRLAYAIGGGSGFWCCAYEVVEESARLEIEPIDDGFREK